MPLDFAAARQQMAASQLRARGISDERVLTAMSRVPRHEFISEAFRSEAYEDHPLPIGEGQTISQPYIVAVMLQALALQPPHTVLEIGTGSGYQTALLAELTHHVYSLERIPSLAGNAASTLSRLGYKNTTILSADGTRGLPEHAPYDAIIVAAAAPEIPQPLLDQLRDGASMAIPVGPSCTQQLLLIRKHADHPTITYLDPCRFVPLISG